MANYIPNEMVQASAEELIERAERQMGKKVMQFALIMTVKTPDGTWDTAAVTRLARPDQLKTAVVDIAMILKLTEIMHTQEKERFIDILKKEDRGFESTTEAS